MYFIQYLIKIHLTSVVKWGTVIADASNHKILTSIGKNQTFSDLNNI